MSAVNKLNSAEAARGRFITLEGGEGCGKSTQAARLRDALAQRGLGVVLARDPGSTALAESLRGLIKDQREDAPCGSCELMLFLAARAQLVERVVRPALAAGKWVVCDRFSDSTVAYQGYGRGLPVDDILRMNDFVCMQYFPYVKQLDMSDNFYDNYEALKTKRLLLLTGFGLLALISLVVEFYALFAKEKVQQVGAMRGDNWK